MNQFTKGDVVYLKSGGTAATVEIAWDDNTVSLVWFDGAVLHRTHNIPAICLTDTVPKIAVDENTVVAMIAQAIKDAVK